MDKVVTVIGFLCASYPSWAQSPDDFSRTGATGCSQGWTGRDSGGSCSWDSTLCNWKPVKGDDLTWEITGTGHVLLNPRMFSGPEKGRLQSPPICEEAGRQVCVQVKFRFSKGGGSRLYVQVCTSRDCTNLIAHVYDQDTDWVIDSANFVTPGDFFTIVILGEKYIETYFGESKIFVDYLRYNSSSCGQKATGVTSLTTVLFSLSPTATTTSNTFMSTTEETTSTDSTTGTGNQPQEAFSSDDGSNNKSDEEEEEQDNPTAVIIGVSAVVLIVLVVAIIVAFILVRRRRRKTTTKSTELGARYERNDSVLMVTNELYACLGQDPAAPVRLDPQGDTTGATTGKDAQSISVTSPEGTSQSTNVSSLPRMPIDYDNIDTKTTATPAGASGPPHKSRTDKNGEAVYDIADDEQGIYENTERSGGDKEDKGMYENTAVRQTEPAAKGTEAAEYSCLMNADNRPDRRQENYDHLK